MVTPPAQGCCEHEISNTGLYYHHCLVMLSSFWHIRNIFIVVNSSLIFPCGWTLLFLSSCSQLLGSFAGSTHFCLMMEPFSIFLAPFEFKHFLCFVLDLRDLLNVSCLFLRPLQFCFHTEARMIFSSCDQLYAILKCKHWH